ncbi:MAG: error-prone DNA polymerase [Rhodospirillales bacterium]|mgnify:CR=1 FL=1|jgi:error-prone DNA polymerase|nr:error-prone DNA polymerase [Rhodospirillales bacterium]MDP6643534.1 error-prone DNA polymerase [Rhodospirillales bacterium]
MTPYAELQVTSNYSFLRGASHPHELVLQAAALGHAAIAIADRNTLAGVVRAHVAAKAQDIQLIVGARLLLQDGFDLLCFPTDRAAYGRLSRLLSLGKRRAEKGDCILFSADLLQDGLFAGGRGQVLVAIPPEVLDDAFEQQLLKLSNKLKKYFYLSVNHNYYGVEKSRINALAGLAERHFIPLVASNDVHAHVPERRPLQDALSCIREHCSIDNAGFLLSANAERHLKSGDEMMRLFADYPAAIANTIKIADACQFSLDELRYEYPIDPAPEGRTPQQELAHLAGEGLRTRYPDGAPDKVAAQVAHELELIGELNYAPYFLTVHDIVRFARSRGILCQGRGSAANSAVCYCLGITSVDPARIDVLFERFVSAERDEPPDIDVDFEHQRREEVIQYIYGKYGRDRAGLTATHITYRSKSAFREIGKVMGMSEDSIQALASSAWGRSSRERPADARITEAGLDPADPTLRMVLRLCEQITGFPRHLSQHTGGFVITKGPLDAMVPIENAAMEARTVIEWDKNDLDAIGILKIDVLGLGMLSCIQKAFELIERHGGRKLTLANIPAGDTETYDMLCLGDSVGVFQVESRAQMNMLPRLKPRCFYDLVIEVAIVRPGPIQGDMVHPYLRRRNGEEAVEFPSKELEQVLGKTMGVPLFQEQAMKIAIVAAGFTPSEADGLRRAMATFRRSGTLPLYKERLVKGMVNNGYQAEFAERCFKQIEGFGEYGFPESHAASFALLVYVSAWLKCHYPAAFAAALLNSQPMGFYAAAQIVRDAREHGVEVRGVDVNDSDWDCTLGGEAQDQGEPKNAWRHAEDRRMALRLGLRQIKGFKEDDADRLTDARDGGYAHMEELKSRAGLMRGALEKLARADAFQSLGLDRRRALWAVKGLSDEKPLPLFEHALARVPAHQFLHEPAAALPEMSPGEQVADDYLAMKLSLRAHPMALLRPHFDAERMLRCAQLADTEPDSLVRLAGVVLIRQRPGSAKGVVFVTIEDETGIANLIVWPHKMERYRRQVLGSYLLGVEGRLQREGIVTHVVAERVFDYSHRLAYLTDENPPDPPQFPPQILGGRNIPSHMVRPGAKPRKLVPGSRDFR